MNAIKRIDWAALGFAAVLVIGATGILRLEYEGRQCRNGHFAGDLAAVATWCPR